jgi:hypothetical protein
MLNIKTTTIGAKIVDMWKREIDFVASRKKYIFIMKLISLLNVDIIILILPFRYSTRGMVKLFDIL